MTGPNLRSQQEAIDYAKHPPPPATPRASGGFIMRKVIWVGALLAMVLVGAIGVASYAMQTGAPQQGASAAWSCFQIISVYVIARALDELTRGKNGL